MIYFESGIDAAVEPYADRENGHGQPGIASRVGGGREGDRRPELADAVDDFPRERVVEPSAGDHPVGHVGDQHGEYPHGQVREGGNGAVLKQGTIAILAPLLLLHLLLHFTDSMSKFKICFMNVGSSVINVSYP